MSRPRAARIVAFGIAAAALAAGSAVWSQQPPARPPAPPIPQFPPGPDYAGVSGTAAEDPIMLTLRIRVPSNAKSFKFSSNFYSAEFPEWVCSPFNDFFIVLLDSTWNEDPARSSSLNGSSIGFFAKS